MKVIFAKDNSIISYLIRIITWSRWHHCAVIALDGHNVVEARLSDGVVLTPIKEFIDRYKEVRIAYLPCEYTEEKEAALMSKIGNKYGLGEIANILFRGSWGKPNESICSELVAETSGIYRSDRTSRLHVDDIWQNALDE